MNPVDLIGRGYRLGADFVTRPEGDCLALVRHVAAEQGMTLPAAQRDWYRRLRRGDYSVFEEELNVWGEKIEAPKLGSIALCKGPNGYGMAGYWSDGWLSFQESEVVWRPPNGLDVCAIYCQPNVSFASLLA